MRGVYFGLSNKHADWTFIVYIPNTGRTLFRRDVLFNEHSMPFRDARHQLDHLTGVTHHLRRGVAQFSRSVLRDEDADFNLDSWATTLQAGIDHTFVGDWHPVCDPLLSPLHIGDTLFLGPTPTAITRLAKYAITCRDLLTDHEITVPANGKFPVILLVSSQLTVLPFASVGLPPSLRLTHLVVKPPVRFLQRSTPVPISSVLPFGITTPRPK